MALKIPDDRALDPLTRYVIRMISTVADEENMRFILVGATARILLAHVYGLPSGTATRDVDFAFAVEDWAQFNALKARLGNSPGFRPDAKIQHRFYCDLPGTVQSCPVDVLPFGGVEDGQGQFAWPPEMHTIMNMSGYRDAYGAALWIEVEPSVEVPVASLPGMAILKIFAWKDRRHETSKDAHDFGFLLKNYESAGNAERVYDEANVILEAVGHDVSLASAWLLGRDAWMISSEETRDRVRVILDSEQLCDTLTAHMVKTLPSLDSAKALLMQFVQGYSDAG